MGNVQVRLNTLAFLPCAVSSLSILGSVLTLLTIYRITVAPVTTSTGGAPASTSSRRQLRQQQPINRDDTGAEDEGGIGLQPPPPTTATKRGRALTSYHRLMIGISVFDILFSAGLLFGPLPIPADNRGIPYARGTIATCTAQGFFIMLGLASFAYNAMLLIYYVLVIRYIVRDEVMTTRIEPFMHAVAILYYTGAAVAGLPLQVYNPTGAKCFIGVVPPTCLRDPDTDCVRGGEHAWWFGQVFYAISNTFWTAVIILAALVVAGTVVARYCRSRKFVFRGSEGNQVFRRQAKEVAIQCFLYSITFVNLMIWSNLGVFLLWSGQSIDSLGKHFWIMVVALFFQSSQGLFNFLIFIRPRYVSIRRERIIRGRWFALRDAIWNPNRSFVRPPFSRASRQLRAMPSAGWFAVDESVDNERSQVAIEQSLSGSGTLEALPCAGAVDSNGNADDTDKGNNSSD